jgi:hypothetical protein
MKNCRWSYPHPIEEPLGNVFMQAKLKLGDHEHNPPFEIYERSVLRRELLARFDTLQRTAKRIKQCEI